MSPRGGYQEAGGDADSGWNLNYESLVLPESQVVPRMNV